MYIDFIEYKLASGISEEQFIQESEVILESWMKHQKGFISWEIHRMSDGKYIDRVCWKDQQSAKDAEVSMQKDLPADSTWYACYDFSSIVAKNGEQVFSFAQ